MDNFEWRAGFRSRFGIVHTDFVHQTRIIKDSGLWLFSSWKTACAIVRLHPFTVTLNGKTVYEACQTNVFSLFSLLPGVRSTRWVQAEGESLTCTFTTEAETFFVDASRHGLRLTAPRTTPSSCRRFLPTCPKGGTVYVPAGRYRTCSLFLKSNTTLYLEKGAVLLGDNDRTHYPILPGFIPRERVRKRPLRRDAGVDEQHRAPDLHAHLHARQVQRRRGVVPSSATRSASTAR